VPVKKHLKEKAARFTFNCIAESLAAFNPAKKTKIPWV